MIEYDLTVHQLM